MGTGTGEARFKKRAAIPRAREWREQTTTCGAHEADGMEDGIFKRKDAQTETENGFLLLENCGVFGQLLLPT
jgi:hypothetical protein